MAVVGMNTLRFRLNHTDGVSSGYYTVKLGDTEEWTIRNEDSQYPKEQISLYRPCILKF